MSRTAPTQAAITRQPANQVAPTPDQLLARFGLAHFRPGQREAVEAALAGRDSLVVMPTGGGKSLCYQLPALAGSGLVVVVSPLIALMADQLQRLQLAGVKARMLASGMPDGHNARSLSDIAAGAVELVLAAPERFASGAFRAALERNRVALFVVDEAHCVAEWGHDFRPDYLRLADAIAQLGGADGAHGACGAGGEASARPAVMATTATATPRVAQEIARRLGLRDWVSIRSGFDRPNLAFDVVAVEGKGAVARKRAALLAVLGDPEARPAIVYCGTRKDTDQVAGLFSERGIATVAYHAGMGAAARTASQAAFMAGDAEVVVATSAFGMGVDKADVRTVAHWALPTSLEAYYQEAGRGGRDGLPARALLLAARMDLGRLISFITGREMSLEDIKRYVGALRRRAQDGADAAGAYAGGEGGSDVGDDGLGGAGDGFVAIGHGELSERERVLLSVAERAGAVELRPGGRAGLLVRPTGKGSPRKAAEAIRAARNRSWESYKSIERFIGRPDVCRRRQILDHFGDRAAGMPSGRCCDVCDPDSALEAALQVVSSQGGRERARVRASGRARGQSSAHPRDGAGAPMAAAAGADPVAETSFQRLRAWRWERAEGKPAYTVAADAVLEEVLRRRPRTVGELIEIRGIGPAFCERHGPSLLAELVSVERAAVERAAVERAGVEPPAVERAAVAQPDGAGARLS